MTRHAVESAPTADNTSSAPLAQEATKPTRIGWAEIAARFPDFAKASSTPLPLLNVQTPIDGEDLG